MSKSTKVMVAATGALLVAGMLAATPAPAAAGPAASLYQSAGLQQDNHIIHAADKAAKKAPAKKTAKKKAPKSAKK